MSDQSSEQAGSQKAAEHAPHTGFEQMQQLSIYIKETDHVERRPLYLKILEMVKARGGTGATVLKGLASYSASSRSIKTVGFADIQQELPLLVIVVDTEARIEEMLPQLEVWVSINGGLITVQDLEGHCYQHPNLKGGKR